MRYHLSHPKDEHLLHICSHIFLHIHGYVHGINFSGSGNVAQYTVEKVIELGGKVVTMSDSDGYIYDPDGIDRVLSYVT